MKKFTLFVSLMLGTIGISKAQSDRASDLLSPNRVEVVSIGQVPSTLKEQRKPLTNQEIDQKIRELELEKSKNKNTPGFNSELYDRRIERLKSMKTNNTHK